MSVGRPVSFCKTELIRAARLHMISLMQMAVLHVQSMQVQGLGLSLRRQCS